MPLLYSSNAGSAERLSCKGFNSLWCFNKRGSRPFCPKSIAAPERPPPTAKPRMADLSPSKEALNASFPLITPETLPKEDGEREVKVEGSIPAWLSGSVIRNGPGGFSAEMNHTFDGYACLVKFTFRDGRVFLNRRFLETDDFKAFKKTGKLESIQFGTLLPLPKLFWGIFSAVARGKRPTFTDNASVNTYPLPGNKQLIAMTEAMSGTLRVDIDSLGVREHVKFNDKLSGDFTTAHPVIYPDGSIYNLFWSIGGERYIAGIDPVTQSRTRLAEVPADIALSPSWIHDLAGSENYIIVPETPTVQDFSVRTILKGSSDYAFLRWAPGEQKTKFQLVPKNGGEKKVVECDFDFMAFHYANAFESADGKEVYVDAPVHDDPTTVNKLYLKEIHDGKEYTPNQLSRITLPLDGRKATIRTLVPPEQYTSTELCRINPNYKFREHQFIFGTSFKQPTRFANALSKMDVKNGTSKQWYEPNCISTEPLMIPRPGATEEDDGVITSMIGGSDGKGFLLVLDAKSFTELARVQVQAALPYGFHNQHYPAAA